MFQSPFLKNNRSANPHEFFLTQMTKSACAYSNASFYRIEWLNEWAENATLTENLCGLWNFYIRFLFEVIDIQIIQDVYNIYQIIFYTTTFQKVCTL